MSVNDNVAGVNVNGFADGGGDGLAVGVGLAIGVGDGVAVAAVVG